MTKLIGGLKLKVFKVVFILLVIIALAAVGFSVYTGITKKDQSSISGAMIAQQAVQSLKLNTITYSYTDSIFISEPEEWMLFNLVDIDPGVRYLAVQYNGIINLGIDLGIGAANLQISEQGVDETGKKILRITLPEAVEISHEQLRNDEVTVLQDGKYTKQEVSRTKLNEAYEERKAYYSENAKTLGLYEQARESAISQIESFLNLIPAISEEYVIRWD